MLHSHTSQTHTDQEPRRHTPSKVLLDVQQVGEMCHQTVFCRGKVTKMTPCATTSDFVFCMLRCDWTEGTGLTAGAVAVLVAIYANIGSTGSLKQEETGASKLCRQLTLNQASVTVKFF